MYNPLFTHSHDQGHHNSSCTDITQLCPICEEAIKDFPNSIFCKGPNCNSNIHRQCAGLSKTALSYTSKSEFTCNKCRVAILEKEVSALRLKPPSRNLCMGKKFTVIVHGIEECEQGTAKHAREVKDLSKVLSLLSKVDASFKSESVKHHQRLGKYDPKTPTPKACPSAVHEISRCFKHPLQNEFSGGSTRHPALHVSCRTNPQCHSLEGEVGHSHSHWH